MSFRHKKQQRKIHGGRGLEVVTIDVNNLGSVVCLYYSLNNSLGNLIYFTEHGSEEEKLHCEGNFAQFRQLLGC